MKRFLATLILLSLAAAPMFAQSAPEQRDTTMQNLMDAYAREFHGEISLYAKQLKTGQEVELAADQPVNTASVIKVPILLETMYLVKAGKVSLEDMLPLTKADQVSGSGVLWLYHAPAQINFETALVLMITQSDNTATNLVLDHIGRENVNQRLRALGFKLTTSIRKINRPGTGDNSPELKPFGIGRTTAREMAQVLESIERCDLGEQKLCDLMIDMMRHQAWRNAIPHFLEKEDTTEELSSIANKTGSLDAVRNDVAIVFTKDGPIVISAFTHDNQDQSWTPENEAEILIGRIAKTIVDGWAPQGLGETKK